MDHKKTTLENRFKSIFFMLIMMLPFCFCTSFANNMYGEFTDGFADEVFSGNYLKAVFLKMQELYNPLSSSTDGKALINKIVEKTTDAEFEILASEIREKIPRFLNQPYKVSELLFVYNNQTLYLLLPKFYTVQAQNRSNSYTIDWKYLEENSYYLTIGYFYNNDTPSSSATVTLLESTSSNIFYNGVSRGFAYGTSQNSSGETLYTVSIPYAVGFETSGDTAEDYQSILFAQINAQPSGLLPRKITSNVILDKSTFEGGTGNENDSSINTNQIITGTITNPSGEITGQVTFSGDINITSGEIENALNVDVDVSDPTADFFTWFFEQIASCFTVNTNQVLEFEILGNEFAINSDDYIINIEILKNVIGVGSSIFIFYGIFQDIRREIEKIKEGKFSEIANEDISANMM